MASINVSTETHNQLRMLAFGLASQGVRTNIGDVADQMWYFVRENHQEEFKKFVRDAED